MLGCNTLDHFNEGVEFAICLDDEEIWIPLAVVFPNIDNNDRLPLGNPSNLVIRDYPVDPANVIMLSERINVNVSLRLCDFEMKPRSIQLRWLQTSQIWATGILKDVWGIDDLEVSAYTQDSMEDTLLLSDSFDEASLK